jgi:uncharacterized protein (DUF2141 family)
MKTIHCETNITVDIKTMEAKAGYVLVAIENEVHVFTHEDAARIAAALKQAAGEALAEVLV